MLHQRQAISHAKYGELKQLRRNVSIDVMARYQITRTRKDGPDPDRRIDAAEVSSTVYWTDQIIRWIDNGDHSFYTSHAGRIADVYVRERDARKYLTTSRDGYGQNNLLLLPDC